MLSSWLKRARWATGVDEFMKAVRQLHAVDVQLEARRDRQRVPVSSRASAACETG